MSRSKPDSAAIRLQQESLDLQRLDSERQFQFLQRQQAALEKQQVAPFRPASPPPTPVLAGADYAATVEKLEMDRRFGFTDTIRGGVRRGVAA